MNSNINKIIGLIIIGILSVSIYIDRVLSDTEQEKYDSFTFFANILTVVLIVYLFSTRKKAKNKEELKENKVHKKEQDQ